MARPFLTAFVKAWPVLLGAATIFGVLLSIFLYYVGQQETVSAATLFIVMGVCLCFLAWAIGAVNWLAASRPKLIARARAYSGYLRRGPDPVDVLIADGIDSFAVGMECSVYSTANDVERLIGIGNVLTIQQDGNAQILVEQRVGASDEIWQKIIAGEPDALKACFVRPGRFRPTMEIK